MPLSRALRLTSLTFANLLIPIAVLVFASGFFPYKPVLPGLATWEDDVGGDRGAGAGVEDVGSEGGRVDGVARRAAAPFNKVVFMVVDALRSDFVYGEWSGMEFTQSLIRSGAAIPFTAHAAPPTVTMPRIKALTTGSVPSFLDLILNFAESDTSSSLALQDTWLAQLRAQSNSGSRNTDGNSTSGGNLVFYGDDTWLKLFPDNYFKRSDGTTSFFVSDFTEVDLNVTRHVPFELAQDDWKAIILHYLGLDHIGHKTGPQGPSMLPKQREMDGVVKTIYEAMETNEHLEDTLLVLAGDHGMNAGGNHGGSGPGETEPALLFASPKFKDMEGKRKYKCPTSPKDGTEFHFYTKVEQSDVVPTLAGLMGFSVPKNSLGVFILELGGLGRLEHRKIEVWRRNAKQMEKIVEATFGEDNLREKSATYHGEFVRGQRSNCSDVSGEDRELACKLARARFMIGQHDEHAALAEFLYSTQDVLSSTASSYNILRMVTGTALAAISLVLAILAFPSHWPPSLAGSALTVVSLLYGIMMFASSYVEEEQHFWYWLTPAWLALLAIREFRSGGKILPPNGFGVSKAVLVLPTLALHRLMIRWNQTGQKYAGEPDIVHTFFPSHHLLMWSFTLITYIVIGFQIAGTSFAKIMMREAATSTAVVMIMAAVVFKLNFTQADAPELVLGLGEKVRAFTQELELVVQARVVFIVLALATGIVVVGVVTLGWLSGQGKTKTDSNVSLADRLHPLLTLFLITQTRAPNVPLFLFLELQRILIGFLLPPTPNITSTGSPQIGRNVLPLATTSLLLSQTAYFAFGGSNSISSLDLSNAYNGVADYNIAAVGILLFASNWAGTVWWCSGAVTLLLPRSASGTQARAPKKKVAFKEHDGDKGKERSWIDEERKRLRQSTTKPTSALSTLASSANEVARPAGVWALYVTTMTAFIATSVVAVMVACTALRTHLFIWTVFSPKYLYAMAWAVGWHLGVNCALGNLLWWLGGVV